MVVLELATLLSFSLIGRTGRWNTKGLTTEQVRLIEMIMICPFSASYWEMCETQTCCAVMGGRHDGMRWAAGMDSFAYMELKFVPDGKIHHGRVKRNEI